MNKAEFATKVADKLTISKAKGSEIVDTVLEVIKMAVKAGDKVSFMGFGSFEAKQKAARTGRNPQTGKEIKIKAKRVPKFSAGKEFKELVNKK